MQNISPEPTFNRGAVRPIECLKLGWELIKDQYWLFVGMAFVTFILSSFVPFGILMGPMMCGYYLALLQRRRGQTVEFGTLFKGFDYFGDSVIAALAHYVPMMIIIVGFYIVFYGGFLVVMVAQGGSNEPDPTALFGFLGVMLVAMLAMMVVITVITLIFNFSYPLIVDRRLSGIEAVKLSAKAALANFWPLLGLMLLNGLIATVGLFICYIGIMLAIPLTYAAVAVAYEQVFGLGQVQSPNLPPPPPSFANAP